MHRSISFASILWAPFTYLSSIWLYQAYPDEIEIPIDTYLLRGGSNSSDFDNGGSVWDRPVNIQKKTKKVSAPEESVEDAAPTAVRNGDSENAYEEPAAPKKSSVWD